NGGLPIEIPKTDPKLMELINEQNLEWTQSIQRQLNELQTLRKHHMKEQCDLLKELLTETQKTQLKEINDRHLREKKDLELSQVRQNLEDTKKLEADKSVRSKAELERRVRESKSNNTKKFVEERKRQGYKQQRELELLTKSHDQQKLTLGNEIDKMLEHSLNYQDESPLARFPSSSV
ncbi:unnamed protein product, partial [Didymodactylos carnosus]